jgi:hypothetical protein
MSQEEATETRHTREADDNAEAEPKAGRRGRRIVVDDDEDDTLKIEITTKDWNLIDSRGVAIPGAVRRHPAFKFNPQPFEIGRAGDDAKLPQFKQMLISDGSQTAGLKNFIEDPVSPQLYFVSGEFDDLESRYFAVYLVVQHLKRNPNARVLWHHLKNRAITASMIENDTPASMLVLTGVYATMSPYRLEHVRDLLDTYEGVPRVVVASGEDPITFCMGKLLMKPSKIYFSRSALSAR